MRGRHIGIVGDDPCAPGRQQLGDPRSDPPEADEADGLAGESVGGAAADVIGEVVRGAPFPRATSASRSATFFSSDSMKAMVVSATPKQLDSVGAWQTMMPSSVAASVSTSSTPTVYLATMRSRCEACMIRRLIGVWRMDVPMSATASRAASMTASSWVVRGNCQARSPKTSSQPMPSSALTVSGGSSRGAKIRIFGFDIAPPWLDCRGTGRFVQSRSRWGGGGIS
jgi:hypothetical protein